MPAEPLVRLIIIAEVPPPQVDDVRALMRACAAAAASETALAYPPHVTLRTGALIPVDALDRWTEDFAACVREATPAAIRTDRFVHERYQGEGERRHFFGYTIEASRELIELHDDLCAFNRAIKGACGPYRPHLSIAYGDVTEKGARAIEDLIRREPDRIQRVFEWTCDRVGVYRRADRWVRHASLPVGHES